MAARTPTLLTAIRFEALNGNGVPPPPPRNLRSPLHQLYISKPSWVVRTESNVRKEKRSKPDPPCVVCEGSGRVDCHHCRGKGRTNCVESVMLPKGEWPKWCRTCGGSGLDYCSRCLGTGEYRYIMGFQFMKRDAETEDNSKNHERHDPGPYTAADLLLNKELSNSNHDI